MVMTVAELAKLLSIQPTERQNMPVFIRVESELCATYDEVCALDEVTLFEVDEAVPTLVLRAGK